jgi:hypothetical protein
MGKRGPKAKAPTTIPTIVRLDTDMHRQLVTAGKAKEKR